MLQESRAVAGVSQGNRVMPQLFFLAQMLADNIHYKFNSSQASKANASEHQIYRHKTEFNAKWQFKVIQSHVFWSQWKG